MRAQVINQFGDADVFKLAQLDMPEIKSGHVIIKVAATSVNQIDCKIRSGAVAAIAPDFPAILHGDVAGTVVVVADDVMHFKVGDTVYGCAGGLRGSPGGGLAEWMLADASLMAKCPTSLTVADCAALPLVGITAWEALFLKANLQPGQQILIHGGVGGVGHIALQLAKSVGARVYTTVTKSEDVELARALGADEVIHALSEPVEAYVQRLTDGRGFAVVFDTVGGTNLDKSFVAAAMGGTVVTTAARSTHDLSLLHSKALSLHAIFMLLPLLTGDARAVQGKILSEIAALVDEKKLVPMIDPQVFSFEQVGEAHRWLESGRAKGKVLVRY